MNLFKSINVLHATFYFVLLAFLIDIFVIIPIMLLVFFEIIQGNNNPVAYFFISGYYLIAFLALGFFIFKVYPDMKMKSHDKNAGGVQESINKIEEQCKEINNRIESFSEDKVQELIRKEFDVKCNDLKEVYKLEERASKYGLVKAIVEKTRENDKTDYTTIIQQILDLPLNKQSDNTGETD